MSKPMYPCLWFGKDARQAAEFYCSVFPDSEILEENPFVISFKINGQYIMGLKDRPKDLFFSDAFSMVIPCRDQKEIDHYWAHFTSDGGQENQCGWCRDKFGFSWQVVPEKLGGWMADPIKGPRVVQAFMKMKKFDIATLENA